MHFWKLLDELKESLKSGNTNRRNVTLRRLYIEATAIEDLREQRIAILDEYTRHYDIERSKIYIDAQHGLCNRLRAIASAAAIAESTGDELVVVWEPDFHCDCEFHDLFEKKLPVIGKSFIDHAKKRGLRTYNYMEIEPDANRGEDILLNEEASVYIRSAYTLNSPHANGIRASQFLRRLTPAPEILKLVDSIDVDQRLGAHIRMEAGKGLDHNIYDSRMNWPEYGHDALHYWRSRSHFSRFINRIDQILLRDDSLQLFIATDRQETYQIFIDYYRDRMVFLERDMFDRSRQQIIFALADLILLSKCRHFLGSTYSSFSELVPRISTRQMPIEMSGKDF